MAEFYARAELKGAFVVDFDLLQSLTSRITSATNAPLEITVRLHDQSNIEIPDIEALANDPIVKFNYIESLSLKSGSYSTPVGAEINFGTQSAMSYQFRGPRNVALPLRDVILQEVRARKSALNFTRRVPLLTFICVMLIMTIPSFFGAYYLTSGMTEKRNEATVNLFWVLCALTMPIGIWVDQRLPYAEFGFGKNRRRHILIRAILAFILLAVTVPLGVNLLSSYVYDIGSKK